MPFELTPNVHVRHGADGKVRELPHPEHPYRPTAADRVRLDNNTVQRTF
jgi:hypothetical protein